MHKTQKNELKYKKYLKRKQLRNSKDRLNSSNKNRSGAGNKKIRTVIEFLENKSFNSRIPLKKSKNGKKKLKVKIPKQFSFSKDPDSTLEVLRQLSYYSKRAIKPEIELNFKKCEELGLCASTVLSSIILEFDRQSEIDKTSFRIGASWVKVDSQVHDMLEISGLMNHLHFPEEDEIIEKKKGYIVLPLIKSRDDEEKPIEKINDYFLECLGEQGFSLEDDGENMLGQMIGEMIGNIDDHNKGFNEWFACGHCEKAFEEECSEVQLTIFNFGVSFYEGIYQDDTKEYSLKLLEKKYIENRHGTIAELTKEEYLTLLTLQGDISRINSGPCDDRGQGTMDLIENFETIGQTDRYKLESLMSITTGNINITFRPGNRGLAERRLFLNDDYSYNDNLRSSGVIRKNKYHFPGSVLSMKFYIDRQFLSKSLRNGGA